jgi:hypothetical protein
VHVRQSNLQLISAGQNPGKAKRNFGLGDLAVHMECVKTIFVMTLDDTLHTWLFYFTVNLHLLRITKFTSCVKCNASPEKHPSLKNSKRSHMTANITR